MLLYTVDMGLAPYDTVWGAQKRAAAGRIDGELQDDLLILAEHPPVVTLGRSSRVQNLLAAPNQLEARGIQVRDVERGGDVTVHEPGQLVIYPIMNLSRHKEDLHWYLRQLEEVIICALASFGLAAHAVSRRTGVWCGGGHAAAQRKIASIGVHARSWVTWHGVALNVINDLSTFGYIVPCGIQGVTMTTVHRECAAAGLFPPCFSSVARAVIQAFSQVFLLDAVELPTELAERLGLGRSADAAPSSA